MVVKLNLGCALLAFGVVFAGLPQPAWGAGHTPPKVEAPAESAVETLSEDHVVEIHKFKFQTKILDVKIGDTVTWVNMDIVPHTATALDKSWDSGRLNKGDSFTLTITEPMSLDYFCAYHRQMKAVLKLVS